MTAARDLTRRIMVGDVAIGAGAPVAVQSMTNLPMVEGSRGPILDESGTLGQIEQLATAGCEIIRTAVPNLESVEAFRRICERSSLPVVADIHFNHLIAIGAAKAGAAKLRINPGNIGTPAQVDAVIDAAGEAGIPIRIGVNAGSLDQKWAERDNLTFPEKLVGSACSYVEHFESRGFKDVVVSAKAHDVGVCVQTYRLLSKEIPQIPLHLGITEAGTLLSGTVKSAYGIGLLLGEGIGDTFRVSLTDEPAREVEVAWDILSACGLRRLHPELVSCPTCSRCQVDMIPIAKEVSGRLAGIRQPLSVAVMGCVVNGPGEAKDADVGIACGKDCGILFAHGEKLRKVPVDHMVDELFDEIGRLEASQPSEGD